MHHIKRISLLLLLLTATAWAEMPVSTYSIVAYDEATGQLGVAVQSHWFSVGALVPWAKAGVGAVATQSFVRVEYGPEGLALMEEGVSAEEALAQLVAQDAQSAVRQVAMIDVKGSVAAHTGDKCIDYAGHRVGKNYSVQANLMASDQVPRAMAEGFEKAEGDLAERLMVALEAAEAAGGDIRGKQSAAILVVSGEPTGFPWKDKLVDLRVEDDPEPLAQMRRLLRINRAYMHANQGDVYLEERNIEGATEEYRLATAFYPENPEMPYWAAVGLAGAGQLEEALPIFKEVFARNPDLKTLTPRLVKAGLLPDDKDLLQQIMDLQ
jgi:uncharacterized Ntn-hydrolase superfamily protein